MSTQTGKRSDEAAEAGPRPVAASRTADPERVDHRCAKAAGRVGLLPLSPARWSIPARSAIIAGAVVLIALTLAGAALTAVVYRALLAGVDDAAARRVGDVAAGLVFDSATDLDAPLLDTDQRIVAVQVLNAQGNVVARSRSPR